MNDNILCISESRFKKGDAFVLRDPDTLTFMEINEIEEVRENMDFCKVTWYSLELRGQHIQRHFSMAARDGKFSNFEPITHKALKEAKKTMRLYAEEVKDLNDEKEIEPLYSECKRNLKCMIGKAIGIL